jgi:diguanylate cyclase (GGDEF)-like protein
VDAGKIAGAENGGRPGHAAKTLLAAVGLVLAYYLAARFSMHFTTSPDGVAVVWLPNAFMLFTLLRSQGRHWWMLPLTVLAEVAADVPFFRWYEAVIISTVNIAEVTAAYLMLRRLGIASTLEGLRDHLRFLLAGPMFGALFGSLLGGAVIKYMHGAAENYLTSTRIWWFSDALGLLIVTPLLLMMWRPDAVRSFLRLRENLWGLAIIVLALSMYGLTCLYYKDALLTPSVLLPPMLYAAYRLGPTFTSVAVAIVSLALAAMVISGIEVFGDERLNVSILHVQELIFTMSIMSLGFALLMSELRQNERQLERRVDARMRELASANEKLAVMAQTDALTGLLNRRAIFELATSDLQRCRRYSRPLAVIMIDLDFFKAVNDTYGHQAGDEVLRHVGAVLRASLRTSDRSARYGGEEFLVVAPEADEETAHDLAERLRAVFADSPTHVGSLQIPLTISLGFALLQPDDDLASLIKRADDALYEAKRKGRNRVERG